MVTVPDAACEGSTLGAQNWLLAEFSDTAGGHWWSRWSRFGGGMGFS